MGKRRMYDDDVEECFDKPIAIFFEAIRYRQQLTPGEFFTFTADKIQVKSGLTYKQQLRARKWLTGLGECSWIETMRKRGKDGGTVLDYKVTAFAKEVLKHNVYKRDLRRAFGKKKAQLCT